MDRTILHCDCNGFYAAVECIDHPQWKEVPMAVCGDPDSRHGIILAKNELAKGYGIKTAETIWQAKEKCRDLLLVPAHHDRYAQVSEQVNHIYRQYTDLVEPFSIDESWLDVTGSRLLFGDGQRIADELRVRVRKEVGVTISAGVSFNKIFAKLGSDYKKPDATTVISRENFREILWPLPVGDMLFVGKNALRVLERAGIHTIGDLANTPQSSLEGLLGKIGGQIWRYARGMDEEPVHRAGEEREAKSVGNSITFSRNLVGREEVNSGILTLADMVAARLRRHGFKCRTVQLTIRDPNFKNISRQKTVEPATDLAGELWRAGMELADSTWNMRRPIRLLGLTASNLIHDGESEQMSLFHGPREQDAARREKLEHAMDGVRDRYGKKAVSYGRLLGDPLGCGKSSSSIKESKDGK